jgi:hypothetical protein
MMARTNTNRAEEKEVVKYALRLPNGDSDTDSPEGGHRGMCEAQLVERIRASAVRTHATSWHDYAAVCAGTTKLERPVPPARRKALSQSGGRGFVIVALHSRPVPANATIKEKFRGAGSLRLTI